MDLPYEEHHALEVLSEDPLWSRPGQYVHIWTYEDIRLDGSFTLEELRQLVAATDAIKQEYGTAYVTRS